MLYWDVVAKWYDFFENLTNKEVNENVGIAVSQEINENDTVLECACGTGVISKYLARKCRYLVATDYSKEMLIKANHNCFEFDNVSFSYGNLMHLDYEDESFDKVVAGNVIHLLDEPALAIKELLRVCKVGGKVIIPTYINKDKNKKSFMVKLLTKSGAGFKRYFDKDSYQQFFNDLGYTNVKYQLIEGNMPCMIAIIDKE